MMSSDPMHDHNGRRDCGARLREAREAEGLSVAEVAKRLRMTVRVIESLEAGDWSRLDAPVFVRGQLRSYARLLGIRLDEELPSATGALPVEPPRLEPRTYTPPLRRAADRMMGRLVYIVITGLIAVPVWMATRSHLDSRLPEGVALDLPGASQSPAPARPQPSAPADTGPRPLVASMAALPQRENRAAESSPAALSLRFSADSWVEIFATDGSVIERGLLKSGERRDYARGEVGSVVLGNAEAVEVRGNGSVQDLSAFQRANVARFTVSSDGSIEPVGQ